MDNEDLLNSKKLTRLLHKQISKTGRAYCIYISPTYIHDEQLKLGKKYTVLIKEEDSDSEKEEGE